MLSSRYCESWLYCISDCVVITTDMISLISSVLPKILLRIKRLRAYLTLFLISLLLPLFLILCFDLMSKGLMTVRIYHFWYRKFQKATACYDYQFNLKDFLLDAKLNILCQTEIIHTVIWKKIRFRDKVDSLALFLLLLNFSDLQFTHLQNGDIAFFMRLK